MTGYDPQETGKSLHEAVARELLDRIRSGEAKPADIACAVKFLRDNGVDAQAVKGTPIYELAENLPFEDDQADAG